MLRVKQVPGELFRYWVESNSLQCIRPECGALFNRKSHADLHVGSECPKCVKSAAAQVSKLDIRFHLVDLSSYNKVGECSCEHFNIRLAPQLARLHPTERYNNRRILRCSHIEAARDFALDADLHQAEHDEQEARKKHR